MVAQYVAKFITVGLLPAKNTVHLLPARNTVGLLPARNTVHLLPARWKMKVKQLERELDRHKHGSQQMMGRNEQLVKEMEMVRQQGHGVGMQLENMRRELGDALVSHHVVSWVYLASY